VRIEEVLFGVKEQRNILHGISKPKANWIGYILRRNCLLQQVIEGKMKGGIEVTGRRGRRRRELLDDLKDRRGYCQLKEEALDRTMWRAGFGRGSGPFVRKTAVGMYVYSTQLRTATCTHNVLYKKNDWFYGKIVEGVEERRDNYEYMAK